MLARGTVINGTATAGDTLNINGEDVVFTTSSLGVVSVQNAVQDINAKTSDPSNSIGKSIQMK